MKNCDLKLIEVTHLYLSFIIFPGHFEDFSKLGRCINREIKVSTALSACRNQ